VSPSRQPHEDTVEISGRIVVAMLKAGGYRKRHDIPPTPERKKAVTRESREMLGIMPPQASPQPQCPCPDTSA
jgi:hypothetical protein